MDQEDAAPPVETTIDRITRSTLTMWAWIPDSPDEIVQIEVFANDTFIGQFAADQFRKDLQDAGKGDGCHSLSIDLQPYMTDFESRNDLEMSVYTVNPVRRLIKTVKLDSLNLDFSSVSSSTVLKLRTLLGASIPFFRQALSKVQQTSRPAELEPAFNRLLDRASIGLAGDEAGSLGDPAISKYAEYVRCRFRVDKHFPVEMGKVELGNYMKWYIEAYCVIRAGKRAPLASYEINYLNELILVGGQTYHLSRATYMFMLDNPGLMAGLDLKSQESYLGLVYWWAVERAPSLFVEDCLIPSAYKSFLAGVRNDWREKPFPLSRFMEVHFSRNAAWHSLDASVVQDRIMIYVVIMLTARSQPQTLDYLPSSAVHKILAPGADGQASPFVKACQTIFGTSASLFIEHTYAELMHACGYDLNARRPLALSRAQDRLLAAALPRPPAHPTPGHVQIIGPMRKASGLGQAARLSSDALSFTGVSQSTTAFDLDNPAPVGFASLISVTDLVCPAVNLIHLNAESIPLAYAFLPDVFSGAYNIGYFFWELDSPAKCHYLALDLLDEIWVSSQYGVDIYAPHTTKPVINVGMAFEDVAPVGREISRAFLRERVGIRDDEFVFMAAFDSFSFIQRKNPQGVVRAFKAAFRNGEAVRLLLKTHNRDLVEDPVQRRIWQALASEIEADPRIVLVNETLSYDDLITLKCGCDCYVSLHKSEGWGFGMVEAMNLGIPVVATGYSGNMEFCNEDTSWLVSYDMKSLDHDDYIFVVPGQRWAEPRLDSAAAQMVSVFEDGALRERRIAAAQAFVRAKFAPEVVGQRYGARLEAIRSMTGSGQNDLQAAPDGVVETVSGPIRRRKRAV